MSFPGYRASFLLWALLLMWVDTAFASVAEVSSAVGASSQAEMRIEGQNILLRLELGQGDYDQLVVFTEKQQQPIESISAEVIQIEVEGKNLKPVVTRYLGNQAGRLYMANSAEAAVTWTDSFASRPGLAAPGSDKRVVQPLMRHVVETTFSLPENKADNLRLTLKPLVDAAAAGNQPLLTPGLIVYHEQIPVTEHRVLSQAETLVLDRQDSWFSRFENPAMNRMLQSVITGILYVEPTEIRQEVIIRLSDLLDWLLVLGAEGAEIVAAAGIENQRFLPPHQQDMLKEKVATLLMTHNALSIEGKSQRAILDRVEYLIPGPHGLLPVTQTGPLDLQSAFIGIVFAYIIPHYPAQIMLDWSVFPPGARVIPVTAFDLTGQFDAYVTSARPAFEWTDLIDEYDFLENQAALKEARDAALDSVQVHAIEDPRMTIRLLVGSIVGALLLGSIFLMRYNRQLLVGLIWGGRVVVLLLAGIFLLYEQGDRWIGNTPQEQLDEVRARQIVAQLLKNIYRSFDFRQEHDVYDKLASSVHGKLLETLYLQNRQAQLRAQAGGARTKVQHVEVTAAQVNTLPSHSSAYHIDTDWTIQGSVAHWGHVHQRQNRYQARLAIEPVDGLWKLTQFDLMDEERIDQREGQP